MRLRLVLQRTAIWASGAEWNPVAWIRGTDGRRNDRRPPEEDPAVKIAAEQIRKDGRVIPENVTKAVELWREKTLKPEKPT